MTHCVVHHKEMIKREEILEKGIPNRRNKYTLQTKK